MSRFITNIKAPQDESGAAAIEFAIIGPALLLLLFGIVSYGGYFWLAHSVQQLANDGARAAVAGLDDSERRQLAQASVNGAITDYAYLTPSATTVTLGSQNQQFTVAVDYDASSSVFWAMKGLVPMPPTRIHRQAVVRLGGY